MRGRKLSGARLRAIIASCEINAQRVEIAAIAGVSVSTLYRWLDQGRADQLRNVESAERKVYEAVLRSDEAGIASAEGISERIDKLRMPKPAKIREALDECGNQVIYFVQVGDVGPVKIGYCGDSERLDARLSVLQTGSPFELHVRRVMPGTRHTERELHRFFHHLRMRGEWFVADEELARVANANPSPTETWADPPNSTTSANRSSSRPLKPVSIERQRQGSPVSAQLRFTVG